MASTITPTGYTFTTVLAPTSYATSVTPNTTQTLDLTTKWGAFVFPMIGRNAATVFSSQATAYWGIRRSFNSSSTVRLPQNNYDFPASTAAVNATTVGLGGWTAGTTVGLLTSGTGFASKQTLLAQLAAARPEFFQVDSLVTNTVTIDDSAGFLVTHNAADTVTNGCDVGAIWLPGGDVWRLTPVNNSAVTLVMACYAEVYASDTST